MKELFFLFFLISNVSIFSMDNLPNHQLIVMRHGEATNNTENFYNSNPNSARYKPANLTKNGIAQVEAAARDLLCQGFNKNNIVAIYVSPLPRTKQTANILTQQDLILSKLITVNRQIIEQQAGDLENRQIFLVWSPAYTLKFDFEPEKKVRRRVQEFYNYIVKNHPEGNILVITHFLPAQELIEIASHEIVKLKTGEFQVVPLFD